MRRLNISLLEEIILTVLESKIIAKVAFDHSCLIIIGLDHGRLVICYPLYSRTLALRSLMVKTDMVLILGWSYF